jgi:hypothetical protein
MTWAIARRSAVATTVLVAACSGSQFSAPQPPDAAAQFHATCGASRPESTPPSRPSGASAANANGATLWFAIERLNLGTTDLRTKMPTNDAWKCYGFDLDGRTRTTTQSEGTCTPRPGASKSSLSDGAGGIDNSFGKNVLPLLRSVDPCTGQAPIGAGDLAFYLRVDDAGAGDTDHAPGALYVASKEHGAAIHTARIDLPVAKFDDGYVSGGVWVSGAPSRETIAVPLQIGFEFELESHKPNECPRKGELRLPIGAVVMTARLAEGDSGMIAGVIASDALEDATRRWLGDFGVCGRSGESIARVLGTESSDLVLGADRFQDPSRTCDAVSFGAAFSLKASADPIAYATFPPRKNACDKP